MSANDTRNIDGVQAGVLNPEELIPRLKKLVPLYKEWNEKINVVSRKDIDNIFEHHILHSAVIGEFLQRRHPSVFAEWCSGGACPSQGASSGVTVMDVGCGGGFPGIPLAVMFPYVSFRLVDSVRKKTVVASSIAASMGLENVSVIWDRVENQPAVDYIVSRAVTNLDEFLSWTWKKTRKGIIYLKGGDIVEEITVCAAKYHIPLANFEVCPVDAFCHSDAFRHSDVASRHSDAVPRHSDAEPEGRSEESCATLDSSLRCTSHQNDDVSKSVSHSEAVHRHSDAEPKGRSEESRAYFSGKVILFIKK